MSIARSIFSLNFLPYTNIPAKKSSRKPQSAASSNLSASSSKQYQSHLLLGRNSFPYAARNIHDRSSPLRRFAVVNAIQPGVPPPSEPTFQLLNWILGFAVTVVIPLFTKKWGSLLKLKNQVETAVETIEEIVGVVEKVAEEVEKVAEDVAEHLPEGGQLRKAVDFVERVADTVDKDAHLIGDFIDKVQEAEEKVEGYVECLVEEVNKQAAHTSTPPPDNTDQIILNTPQSQNAKL